ncbi:immunogenic protein MPT64 [Mycolicibacterium insubricum]|jgi:hypothetical protein|uniref:DUF3298 domain-containing protein n=1 Tax=Mycolicibacterium insubricum TaxID=444597 RepID=A0A1X0DKY9_9MYCO|nr:esterase [Mycolicibacterium insubricum]MCB9440062.1 DUF3298 domain-containing protein [Mycolicibacterium sp.]MCV7082063.1 DUF3298 domain-containing protein [Mycolicibacterium insubricum]ORA72822.1 DUF3298 domain-containing protein [Mycolicibacterium insubricum]BBZ66508.1 immunogenic protein MPT64 [Mycolicibacterium insubricum]
MRTKNTVVATALFALVTGTGMATATAAPPKCSDIGGVQVANTCQVTDSGDGYTVNMAFPALYPNQKPVLEYVKQTRDGFLNLAKGSDSRTAPYTLESKATEYNSAIPPRGTQSVVLETFEWVGGAHPTTFYKAFNWDQGYRKAITIDTLFAEGTNPWPVILPLVQADVARQFGAGTAIPTDTGMDPNTYQNFAITNDSLLFFFDRGAVLPEVAGNFSVTIPRSAVDSMLA